MNLKDEKRLAVLLLAQLEVCEGDNIRIITKGDCKSLVKTLHELSKIMGFFIKNNSNNINKYVCIIGEVSPSLDSPAKRYSISEDTCKKIYEESLRKKLVTVFYPTKELARIAGISLADLRDLFYSSLRLENIGEANRLEKSLSDGNVVRITGEKTNVTFSIQRRRASIEQINIPQGEVFVAPRKYTVEGRIYFNVPIKELGIFDVCLYFSKGKVKDYSCSGKPKILEKIITKDSGSCYVGEFGVGFNKNVIPIGLSVIDEKSYGTIHLALGQSYGNESGINNSTMHVDFVKTKPNVFVDGKRILQGGTFVI